MSPSLRKIDLQFMHSCYLECFPEPCTITPAQWCVENLEFNEAGNHGPFRLDGCEYIEDVVDDWGRPEVTDEVLVFGSQTRKTGSLMGGACWALKHDPCGMLWVMPNLTLARKFSKQRLKRMIAKSAGTAQLVSESKQADKNAMADLAIMLGASTINLVGSNSAANLSSNPCRRVIQDETDKFDTGGQVEADASNLADQRTKDQVNPQRWKTSTPTITSGLIWQEYLKGNQMRYHVPCPHCQGEVIFTWSKQFTVLPLTRKEAFIRWADDAKHSDGTWDLDRVRLTAHVVCPHCNGKIEEGHKKAMVKTGKWRATNSGAPKGFISRHLPSMYASSPETSFGALAVKFLQAKRSLMGLQGFINGDLAEPYQSQDLGQERVELVRQAQIEITAEWRKVITADVQQKWPYIWFVVRAWNGGDSEGVECGHVDLFDGDNSLRAIQIKHGIIDAAVIIDSGHGAKDDAAVYRECATRGVAIPQGNRKYPMLIGWMPAKGFPVNKRWPEPKTKHPVPWFLRPIDPWMGTTNANLVEAQLFEFSSQYYEGILSNLRNPNARHGYKWAVSQQMDTYKAEDGSTYWRHMDGHILKRVENKFTGRVKEEYCKRHTDWPDHLLDCENLQVAHGHFQGWFTIDKPKQ